MKKVFLETSQNSQENTCARVFFLINLQVFGCKFVKKETLAQVFSCEFCEICKNTFSYRTPPVAAFDFSKASIFSHLRRKEYLVYQQLHQFLTSPLFDTEMFFNMRKEEKFLLRSHVLTTSQSTNISFLCDTRSESRLNGNL